MKPVNMIQGCPETVESGERRMLMVSLALELSTVGSHLCRLDNNRNRNNNKIQKQNNGNKQKTKKKKQVEVW